MNRLILICAAMTVSACATTTLLPPSPASLAERTKVDEQAGLLATLAYNAAARAASALIETGQIKDRATIARIGALDQRAHSAVLSIRAAYLAGNSADYATALAQARFAVADLLRAVNGG